jgi:hypothetical protein
MEAALDSASLQPDNSLSSGRVPGGQNLQSLAPVLPAPTGGEDKFVAKNLKTTSPRKPCKKFENNLRRFCVAEQRDNSLPHGLLAHSLHSRGGRGGQGATCGNAPHRREMSECLGVLRALRVNNGRQTPLSDRGFEFAWKTLKTTIAGYAKNNSRRKIEFLKTTGPATPRKKSEKQPPVIWRCRAKG